ncbi:hypothetical protein GOBAR_DD07094 [Gossypium barbadense]|nr:hypothetical protein GOBAR_DD07094 [Gossypium barbadense]
MSTEPTSIEGSVTPPTSIDSKNSGVGALIQTKGTTGKRKATPQRPEVWSHFTKIINSEGARSLKYHIGSCKKNPGNVVDTSQGQLVLPRKGVEGGKGIFQLGDLIKKHGEPIGMVIEKCLLNWGIDKLFTVTVDNASSNDVAIGYLRKKFNPRGGLVQNDIAQNFKRAFERFDEQDTNFRAELERGEGWPSVDDWDNVRNLRDFLEHFYEVTLRISGTSYVTSNNFFDELSEIDIRLRDAQLNSNVDFNVMAIKMKEKYDKYWGDIDKMNLLMFVACVLDPRQKLNYLEFALIEMSSSEKACEMTQKLKKSLYELFDEYKPPLHMNNPRFPTLSNMARDVLAIPISTVASESAFSTGGRVLDQYRSSLIPKIVQALVCTQDWIRKSSSQEDIKKIEEQIQELDKIENGLMQMEIFWREEMDTNGEY